MFKRITVRIIACLLAVGISGIAACRKAPPPSNGPKPGTSTSGQSDNGTAPPPPAAPSDKAQAVIDELVKKYEGLDAFSADTELKLPQAAGMKGRTHGKGTFEMNRVDGKRLTRFAANNNLYIDQSTPEVPGKELFTMEIIWQLYDGEALYLLTKQPKLAKLTKTHYHPDKVLHVGGRDLFRPIFEEADVSIGTDEVVDGRPAYVIDAKPAGGGWSARRWFDKSTGICLRHVETDESGAETFNFALSNLNTTPEFPPDRFRFTKIPEGFEYIDETEPSGPASLKGTTTAAEPEKSNEKP